MKKVLIANGVRVCNQIKVGFDYCQKCRLGCILLGDERKKEICDAVCDSQFCNTGTSTQVGCLPMN